MQESTPIILNRITEDKENIFLLPVDSGLSPKEQILLQGKKFVFSRQGWVRDAGIELVRLGDEPRLFWHKSNSNDPDRNVWSNFVFSLGFRPGARYSVDPATPISRQQSNIVRKVSHFRLSHK
jgi:hypothetical protein